MPYKHCIPRCSNLAVFLLLVLLVSCVPSVPDLNPTSTPVSTPVPTLSPSPTPTPLPTPTATPIPPLELRILWPDRVSALQPVPVEVELVPPPDVDVTATVRALVLGPNRQPRWPLDLRPREGNRYAADEPLQLPLQPPEGPWVLVVYVRSTLDVAGKRHLAFRPEPIRFHDLTDVLPPGVDMRVPQDFIQGVAEGDQWAGGRVWRYGGDELALWWAPGPAEPLLLNNAIVMLEATHGTGEQPAVLGVEETGWQGQTAFLFREDWPGPDGGPAEALVVQGPDRWLYVLRVRTTVDDGIPPLLRQVRETFALVED